MCKTRPRSVGCGIARIVRNYPRNEGKSESAVDEKRILWGGTRKAVRGLRCGFRALIRDYARAARAAFTRSGVNGTWRSRAPVASNIALPTAAATTVIE